MATDRNDASVVRRLGRLLLALLVLVTAFSQLLAWTSPTWWEPLLQTIPTQDVLMMVGAWRDALGVWTIVIAALLLGVVLLSTRRRGLDLYRPLPLLAVAVLVSSVGLWTYQVVDAHRQGADVGVLSPVLPFQRVSLEPDRTVTVGRVDGKALTADLYLPRGADDADGVPVVVNVHGGGFTSGRPQATPIFPALLDRGYAVLDVSYRLATERRPTWDLAVADVGCALTWVTTQGPQAGLDPERVGAMGDSAGGQLAINAANLGRRLDPSCRSRSDLPRVSAVVALYPAVDASAAFEQTALGHMLGGLYVDGSPQQRPRRYAFIDSASHLDVPREECRTQSGSCVAPPLLVVQSGSDHLVLPGPVERFTKESRAAGTTTRYVEMPGQEHTLGQGRGTLSLGALVARDLAGQWFEKHLPIVGS